MRFEHDLLDIKLFVQTDAKHVKRKWELMVVIIVKPLFDAVRNQNQKSATLKIESSITSARTATQEPVEMSPSKFHLVILKHCMKHEDRISNLTDNIDDPMLLKYGPLVRGRGCWWGGGGLGVQSGGLLGPTKWCEHK